MSRTEIAVRRRRRDDVDAAAVVLARAFTDDPVYRWTFPDRRRRDRLLPHYMRILPLTAYRSLGPTEVAAVDGHVVGAAVRSEPGGTDLSWSTTLRFGPGLLRVTGPTALVKLLRLDEAMHTIRPTEPHYYLFHLGTDPGWFGRGVGSALVRSLLTDSDADGVPTYLECKPDNISYYRRFGFEVTERVPFEAVELWGMLRPTP